MKKLFLIVLLIVIAAGGFWYAGLRSSFKKNLNLSEEQDYVVTQGSTLYSVARDLDEKGIIEDADTLIWLHRLEKGGTIFAGTYLLAPSMTVNDLYGVLTSGETQSDEVTVKVIEGWTLVQIADALVEAGLAQDSDAFLELASDAGPFKQEFSILADIPAGQGLEGYLFPDTYRFFADASLDDVIRKMVDHLETQVTSEMRAAAEARGMDLHELMILASIVEKEVRSEDEMRTVAGIFTNRLEIGMALQADSTVNYITSSGRARSTLEDLQIDSPYNTYKHAGLTPGPISNPGLRAIQAAVNPADTEYLYFLTDLSGDVYYASTHDQHLYNRRYLDQE